MLRIKSINQRFPRQKQCSKKEVWEDYCWEKISCDELPGRPTRYIVKVEYEINNVVHEKKVITTDKNIKKYADNGQIRLLYVDKIDKVYWAEDKSNEIIVIIVLLALFSASMFLLPLECLFTRVYN